MVSAYFHGWLCSRKVLSDEQEKNARSIAMSQRPGAGPHLGRATTRNGFDRAREPTSNVFGQFFLPSKKLLYDSLAGAIVACRLVFNPSNQT